MRINILQVLLLLALAASCPGQIRLGEFGFEIQGAAGVAGDACWGFDCTPRRLAITPGEGLAVQVRAPLGAPFWVFASAAARPRCVSVVGLHNALVLDGTILPVFVGRIDQRNTTRFCYDGFWRGRLAVPVGLPPGVTIYLQSVAVVGTPSQPNAGLALSSAIALTAR